MNLAVNFIDLDRNPPFIVAMLVMEHVYRKPIKVDDSRVDEYGVAFKCDLLKAACICDTLRTKDRNVRRYPTRVYVRKVDGGGWSKVPGGVSLTRVHNDDVYLNPGVFPDAEQPKESRSTKAVLVGRRLA